MKILKFVLVTTILLMAFWSNAQDMPDIATDRPDQSESSSTIPKKTFQIESGFVFESDKANDMSYDNWQILTTLFRYGLFDGFELRLISSYSDVKMEFGRAEADSSISGLTPIILGFKAYITEQKGVLPEMSILGHFTLPNTGGDDFQIDRLDASFRLACGWSILDNLGAGLNLGATWDEESEIPVYFYSCVVGVTIVGPLNGFVEVYGDLQDESFPVHKFDAGLTYLIKHNFQLDASFGLGISDIAPDYFVNAGFAWRIPN